jgi:hypothetical protein
MMAIARTLLRLGDTHLPTLLQRTDYTARFAKL